MNLSKYRPYTPNGESQRNLTRAQFEASERRWAIFTAVAFLVSFAIGIAWPIAEYFYQHSK